MHIDFSNKAYLVTGGASGIGAAVVRYLAEHGAKAVIADIDDEAGRQLAEQFPDQLHYIQTDVTDFEALQKACNLAEEKFGRLDGAVNSAGIGSLGSTVDMPLEEWQGHQYRSAWCILCLPCRDPADA